MLRSTPYTVYDNIAKARKHLHSWASPMRVLS